MATNYPSFMSTLLADGKDVNGLSTLKPRFNTTNLALLPFSNILYILSFKCSSILLYIYFFEVRNSVFWGKPIELWTVWRCARILSWNLTITTWWNGCNDLWGLGSPFGLVKKSVAKKFAMANGRCKSGICCHKVSRIVNFLLYDHQF